jgi:4-amino-4-deoxy-L-arabinose transferase-like glycosyltransferase
VGSPQRSEGPVEAPGVAQAGIGAGPAAPVLRWEAAALAAILVLAAAFRLRALGAGLWYDEIETLVRYARQPLAHIVTTYDSQNQHLLYSVMARLSLSAFGDGASALRLPAAVFGVVSVWAAWYFARALVPRGEALVAALLLATSYHHVWFSQDARGYTALMAFTLVASRLFLALLRAGQGPWRWRAVGYAVVMGLAVYTHLTALFVSAAHGLLWLWSLRGPGARTSHVPALAALAGSGAVTLLLYAPVAHDLVATAGAPTMPGVEVAWRSPWWFVTEVMGGLVRGLPGGWLALAAAAVVGTAGVASWWRRDADAAAVMLLPVAVTAGVLLVASHNLWPRFFFFAAGFAVLIVVRGGIALAGTVAPRPGAPVAVAAFAVAAAVGVAMLPRAWRPKQDYEGARAWLSQAAAPGNAVVVVDMTRLPFLDWLHTGWTAVDGEPALAAVEAAHGRTWVAYTFPARLAAVQPALWARLRRDYRVAREFPGTVGGGTIVVMVRG